MQENKKQIVTVIIIFLILVTIVIAYMTYMLNRIEANTNNSIKTIVKNSRALRKNRDNRAKGNFAVNYK